MSLIKASSSESECFIDKPKFVGQLYPFFNK